MAPVSANVGGPDFANLVNLLNGTVNDLILPKNLAKGKTTTANGLEADIFTAGKSIMVERTGVQYLYGNLKLMDR